MNKAKRMPPASWVEAADVDAVLPLALERGANYFSDLWRSESGGELGQRLLEALIDQQALQTAEPDERKRREALKILLRRDIIERDGDGFRISVPLVAEYVRLQRLI